MPVIVTGYYDEVSRGYNDYIGNVDSLWSGHDRILHAVAHIIDMGVAFRVTDAMRA